jgi:hypothetical protein
VVRLRWTQLSELRCARRSIGRGWCAALGVRSPTTLCTLLLPRV